ncbi:hypothetical protein CLV92_101492 [Kineococcus xinjiangensis]|uniref:General stress protein 17M-like domain-containing protein n=1 Tax=Kineococcus xinjiangensis TaxID=512762 RepID=A0A2S6IXB5_9ACTN|nr:general stress protein [Kineococcus xinjiangensis]PPK98791.1 hypothetical protein CLV92_101492 [Kineococcus xinjiangensis]
MSNFSPMGGSRPTLPTPPQGDPIGRYSTYEEAQRAVDFLSDEQFPVQNVTIVGTNLQMVERVTGRLTYARAAGAGAASGAWFGLFVGLLLSFFGDGGVPSLLSALFIGAGFGMFFGVISFALTGGRRDFTSASQIVAGEYTVLCTPGLVPQAVEVLERLPGGRGRGAGAWGAPQPQPPQQQGTWQAPWGPGPSGSSPAPRPPEGTRPPQGYGPPPAPGTAVDPSAAPPPPPGYGEQEPQPAPTGPTYSEQIERQRRERREREERERLEREQGPGSQG